jgi:hypothetical protein
MNFWDWAHQHPYALVFCVFLISAAAIEVAAAIWGRG